MTIELKEHLQTNTVPGVFVNEQKTEPNFWPDLGTNSEHNVTTIVLDSHEVLPVTSVTAIRRVQGMLIPYAVINVVWLSLAVKNEWWSKFNMHYPVSLAMIVGSFSRGLICEGGGVVVFPVMTLVLKMPAIVAKSFCLMIQSCGLSAASFCIFWTKVNADIEAILIQSLTGIPSLVLTLTFVPFTAIPSKYTVLGFVTVYFSVGMVLLITNTLESEGGLKNIARKIKCILKLANNRSNTAASVERGQENIPRTSPKSTGECGEKCEIERCENHIYFIPIKKELSDLKQTQDRNKSNSASFEAINPESVDGEMNRIRLILSKLPAWPKIIRVAILLTGGAIGGAVTALTGSGIDVVSLLMLRLIFKKSEKITAPTSVILLAVHSAVGFFWSHAILNNIIPAAWDYFIVCIPIVTAAAPLGSLLNSQLPREVIAGLIYISSTIGLISGLVILKPSVIESLIIVATIVGLVAALTQTSRKAAQVDFGNKV